MSQHNFRKKIPETCRFWRESKCQKGEYQCSFVHGYICPNDGRCWRENCNRIHFNQKNMQPRDHYARPHTNYQRGGHRPRYPRSHSRSQSPPRHRKVFHRGRSPPRHRSRSRSPTYHTRVYSPYQRRSRSRSPFRGVSRSLSPLRHRSRTRSRSRDWHPSKSQSASRPNSRGHSPDRVKSRSSSPIRSRSKSHSSAKLHNKGYTPSRSLSRSPSPKLKKRSSSSRSSSSSSTSTSTSSNSKRRPKSRTDYVHPQSSSPSSVKDIRHEPAHSKSMTPVPLVPEIEGASSNRHSGNAGRKMKLDLENIYADLECETNPLLTVSETLDKDAVQKEALSKLQAHIARDFMNPETQKLMEQVLSSTKGKPVKPNPSEENKSKKDFFLDEVGDDIELDLEEVGEEVDDIFAKSINRSMDDSNEDSFDKGLSSSRKLGLQAGSNPSPPKANPVSQSEKLTDHFLDVDFHTDWDLKAVLETASKSLKNPPQIPPPNHPPDGSKIGSTSLWTPALARHQTQAPKNKIGYQRQDNDWEVETPYVGRKDKSEIQRSAAPSRTAINDAPADVSSSIPFALPVSEPLSTHKNSHKGIEISQENKEAKKMQQADVLFPSAQSISSGIPSKISHTVNQPSKPSVSSVGQSALATSILPSSTANLIRDATDEKELYQSPKEGATAPKKVSEEQIPRKSSESPKRSKRKHRKEKKAKRKKDSSSEDEDDSSESEDSKEDKKSSQEKEKDSDEIEVLLFKRESLMKRVKLLVEQKNMMSNQREDIISNHKGTKASLSSILEENSFLTKEIGKQIGNINNMIKNINEDIETKRGNFKQKTSVSKPSSESPHVSRETYKISQHSAERERIPKKMIKPNEKSEVYRASPYQESRSKSPHRIHSRSPSPVSHFKHAPTETEQKLKDRDNMNSWSPKGVRHKRSRSPNANAFREVPRPVSPPEVKQSTSPSRKRSVKSMIEVNKKPAGPSISQHQAPKTADSSLQYAPHEAQRTYIRYIDQGMHWCKLCSLFCETAPEYVNHLMTESHLARVKNDRKSWLSKAPKEDKDPKPPNAQVLTVPIQGLEFLHSLPCYYCSLCDTFLRDRGEALRHPESKMHVSKYKVHRAQNPLFESTFLKAKTTAYAKYKIDEERKKMESEFSLNEKTTSLENKLLKQIKEKLDKENKEDRTSDGKDDSSKACGSIRVASRGPRYSTDKKPSTTQPPHGSVNRQSREKETLPKTSDGSKKKTDGAGDSKTESQTNETVDSDNDDNMDNSEGSEKNSVEDKVEAKQKEEGSKDGSRETDTGRKTANTKLPLIGKMPFLKRKAGISKSKEQQNTPVEEVSKQKKEPKEDNLPEELKIPLPSSKIKEINTKKLFHKTQLAVKTGMENKDLPVATVNSKEKVAKPDAPNSPPLTDAMKSSTSNKKDAGGSALYDPLEAVDEDSSEGVAAATIEALDLLNIPLPGFKTPADTQELSAVPLPPEMEDVYQPEDMEIDNTPMDEEGIEEVDPSSGIIVHTNIPLPPWIEVPPTQVNLNEPPPPGTEGTINCEININVHPGNILPVFGPQNIIPKKTLSPSKIQRKEDVEIPVPPGTEDEYNTGNITSPSHTSGQSQDKINRTSRKRLHSGSGSPASNSRDVPLSFSGKILGSSPMKPISTSKIQQKQKKLPHHAERELTPPPPGTESLLDEKDQYIMTTTNKAAIKDLKVVTTKSASTPFIPKIHTSEEKLSFSPKNNSSSTYVETCTSSRLSASNKGKANQSKGEASEIVQKMYVKDSSNECSTADTKDKELNSKRSYTPSPRQSNDEKITMSSHGSSLTLPDKAFLPSAEGNPGSIFFTSTSLVDTDKLVPLKAVVSHNIDSKKYSSNQCLTVNTSDEKQDSKKSDEDESYTALSKQCDTGNLTTSLVDTPQASSSLCDSQDSDKGLDSKFSDEGRSYIPPPKQSNTENIAISLHGSSPTQPDKAFLSSVEENPGSELSTSVSLVNEDELIHLKAVVSNNVEDDKKDSSKQFLPANTSDERQDSNKSAEDESHTALCKQYDAENIAIAPVNTSKTSSNLCHSQDSDKGSASKECLSNEQTSFKENTKDNNECCSVNDTSLIHGKDGDRYHKPLPKRVDSRNIPTSPVNTSLASSKGVSQDLVKDYIFKECMLDEQDNNSSSSIREISEGSNECSVVMNEKGPTFGIDINEEPKSPIIKCGSPLQFVNFPKGFESMDIADLYSPSTSDSTCIQSIDTPVSDSHETKNYSAAVENVIDAKRDMSKTPQETEFKKEDRSELDVEKDLSEAKCTQEIPCSQTIEMHEEGSDTHKELNEDYNSHKSKTIEGEAFPLKYSTERKAARSSRREIQTGESKEHETLKDTEEITLGAPAVLIHETDSKASEEELVSNFSSVKKEKRKATRTPRKRTSKVKKTEEDECTSPKTSASKSSAGHLTPSLVESPRPMRSSRKAAAAAIKAMAKDQDDTPPDSPPSDDDTDYSE